MEADETAFWFLERNGVDPKHFINFLIKMNRRTPSYLKKIKTKYSSHPDISKRIQHLEKLYRKYHNNNFMPNKLLKEYNESKISGN